MLKNLKKILLSILLILPFCFAFVACGETEQTPPPSQNQPEQPGGQNPPATISEYYYVSADYNLTGKLSDILVNPEEVKLDVNSKYSLITFSGILADYFDGWFDKSTETKIDGTEISGSKDEHIQIYAQWKPELYEFYYTTGVQFVTDSATMTASVSAYDGSDTKVILPKSVMVGEQKYSVASIGSNVFENSDVSCVTLLGSEIDIEDNAFSNSKLESFDFEAARNIGASAFSGTKITDVTLSNKAQSVSNSAFSDCSSLESIDFTQASALITKIPNRCFNNCLALSEIRLSAFITELQSYAFAGCTSLSDISFINTNITALGSNVFAGNENISELSFMSNLSSVSSNAFNDTAIQKVNLYKLITGVGVQFKNFFGSSADSIVEVDILGNDVSSIPDDYFADISNMETFRMSDSIMSVGTGAFDGCSNLKNITFSDSLNSDLFSADAFDDTAWYNENNEFLISNSTLLLAPKSCPAEVSAADLAGITGMVQYAFSNNKTLEKITFPSTLLSIPASAFQGCSNLQEIDFENDSNLTKIDTNAFNSCAMLTKLNLDKCTRLEEIGDNAFQGIGSVDEVALPASLTKLGSNVFGDNLIKSYRMVQDNEHYSTQDGVLYAGEGQTQIYAYPMLKEAVSFTIPETVKSICSSAFNAGDNNTASVKLKYLIIISDSIEIPNYAISNIINVFSKCELNMSIYQRLLASENYTFNESEKSITVNSEFLQTLVTDKLYKFLIIVSYADGSKHIYTFNVRNGRVASFKENLAYPTEIFPEF